METIKLSSEFAFWVGYDEEKKFLYISTKPRGKVYRYEDVPKSHFGNLLTIGGRKDSIIGEKPRSAGSYIIKAIVGSVRNRPFKYQPVSAQEVARLFPGLCNFGRLDVPLASLKPTRIVIDSAGNSVAPAKAPNIKADYVFFRDDGWTLAAPRELALVAYNLWPDKWEEVWFGNQIFPIAEFAMLTGAKPTEF